MARAAANSDNLSGASAAVGGGDDDGRRGRTLTGKGRGPARRRRHAIKLIFTKLRNSFVEFNGTGEDNNENTMYVYKKDLYGKMMGHIKLY